MRKLLTLLLLVMGSSGLWAQITYLPTFSANVGSPGGLNSDSETTTTGWVEVQPPSQSTNVLSSAEAIGFPFDFFGTPVTHFKASLNGVVTFDTATTVLPGANTNLPSAGLPDMSIAGLWDEFTASAPTGTNDRVWRKTFGTPGSQQLWIKWFSFEYGNPNVSFAYFCIVLEEGSNNVYVVDQYSSGSPQLTRTVGVQLDANTAVQFGNDQIGQDGNGTSLTDNEVWGFSPFLPAPFNTYVISASSSGADGACNGAAESVTVQVGNLGTNPATGIAAAFSVDGGPITTPEIIPGTLNPGDTVTYTFTATADLSASGPHTIEVGASVLNDADLSNDSTVVSVNTGLGATAPFVEDFETGTTGAPGTFPTGWTMTGGSYIWHVESDNTTNSSSTGPLDDHTPGGSLYVFTEASSGSTGDITELTSPCIDISALANPSLEFWYHMYGSDMGTLEVDVISGGVTTTIFTLSGQQQSGENEPWNQQILSLANFSGTIQVVFRGIRGSSFRSDISVDDINLYDQPPVDIAILSVDQPVDPSCFGPNQTVEVTYTNYGSDTVDFAVDTLDFILDITGPIPAMFTAEVNSGTLAPFDTLSAVITTAADLSAAGIYTLSIDANVNGDTNGSNDSVAVTRERIAPLIPSLTVVDFTGFNSSNLSTISPGWFEDEGVGNPNGGTTSSWVRDDYANVSANGDAAKINL
ncbi:MAG: CARDB domain-containing protein, partial [Bacteroidota bacterium]